MNAEDRAELHAIRDRAVAAMRDLRAIADAYAGAPEGERARDIADHLDSAIGYSADHLLGDERPAESQAISDPAANPRPRARAVRDEIGQLCAAARTLWERMEAAGDRGYADVLVLDGDLFKALRRVNTDVVHDDRYEGLIQ
jgi:hypothetical protein